MQQDLDSFPKEQQHFFLTGPEGQLEVLTTWPRQLPPMAVGIVCHPHPLHQGTMQNKVVTTIARAFDQLGLATVRFNYRGVGQSAGKYGHMQGETQDLLAIISWLKKVLPTTPLWLAGFSFGSFISANAANQLTVVKQLISIAPAVNHADFKCLTQIQCPWLVIQGDQDEVVSVDEVIEFAKHPPSPLDFVLLPGVSHFFHGKLVELRELLIKKLS